MDILQIPNFGNLKRNWRRRRYQRLDDASNNKKKLRIARLGSKKPRGFKLRIIPKLRLKFISPIRIFSKFHEAYVNTMIRLVGYNKTGIIEGKRVPRREPIPMVSTSSNEIVDGRLVLEIYKRMLSSRESAGLLV